MLPGVAPTTPAVRSLVALPSAERGEAVAQGRSSLCEVRRLLSAGAGVHP